MKKDLLLLTAIILVGMLLQTVFLSTLIKTSTEKMPEATPVASVEVATESATPSVQAIQTPTKNRLASPAAEEVK